MDDICLTEQLSSFNSRTSKNLEVFTSLAAEISDLLKVSDEPQKCLKSQTDTMNSIRREIGNLKVEIHTNDSKMKLIKEHKEKKSIDIESVKELIDECSDHLTKLILEKETVHKSLIVKNNALKEAMRFYKHNLHVYCQLTEVNAMIYEVTLCFFTTKFDDTYSVVLHQHEESKIWEFLSCKPDLDANQLLHLKQQLDATNNIVNFTCSIRKLFNCLKCTLG